MGVECPRFASLESRVDPNNFELSSRISSVGGGKESLVFLKENVLSSFDLDFTAQTSCGTQRRVFRSFPFITAV